MSAEMLINHFSSFSFFKWSHKMNLTWSYQSHTWQGSLFKRKQILNTLENICRYKPQSSLLRDFLGQSIFLVISKKCKSINFGRLHFGIDTLLKSNNDNRHGSHRGPKHSELMEVILSLRHSDDSRCKYRTLLYQSCKNKSF